MSKFKLIDAVNRAKSITIDKLPNPFIHTEKDEAYMTVRVGAPKQIHIFDSKLVVEFDGSGTVTAKDLLGIEHTFYFVVQDAPRPMGPLDLIASTISVTSPAP